MKKYLKKLGVLTLIAAMLAPYVSIPSVEAETTSSNCEKRLDSYLFLDSSKIYAYTKKDGKQIHSWLINQAHETTVSRTPGYKTFTNLPYVFPANQVIKNIKVNINNFINDNNSANEEDLEGFWELVSKKVSNLSRLDVLESYGDTFVTDYPFIGEGYTYNSNKNYDAVTAIFHGPWSNEFYNNEFQDNVYSGELSDLKNKNLIEYVDKSLQVLFENHFNNSMNIEFTNAKIDSYEAGKTIYYFEKPSGSELKNINDNYFEKLINGEYEEYTFTDKDNDIKYFTVAVTRKINKIQSDIETNLNENYIFGKKITDSQHQYYGKYAVYSSNGDYSLKSEAKKEDINNSYEGMLNGKYFVYETKPTFVDIDSDTSYYWPAVMNVEYEVCPVNSTTTTSTTTPQQSGGNANSDVKYWNIQYTAKTEDAGKVTNLPSKHSEKLGTYSKVASGTPEKEGYAFKGWCVGTETCTNLVKADDTLTSPDKEGTVTLYAQWGEAGPGEQEKTGVMSYVLGLSAVALVAGGIYYVSKKKNLFKQV